VSKETPAAGYLGRPLEDHLAAMAGEEEAPGAGSAAAVCAAMAAALVAEPAALTCDRCDPGVQADAVAATVLGEAGLSDYPKTRVCGWRAPDRAGPGRREPE
jgi:Formiminotransferase-cyclodeaminase